MSESNIEMAYFREDILEKAYESYYNCPRKKELDSLRLKTIMMAEKTFEEIANVITPILDDKSQKTLNAINDLSHELMKSHINHHLSVDKICG